jgi:hypothetical protein
MHWKSSNTDLLSSFRKVSTPRRVRSLALLLEVNSVGAFVIVRRVLACAELPLLTALSKRIGLNRWGHVRDYLRDFREAGQTPLSYLRFGGSRHRCPVRHGGCRINSRVPSITNARRCASDSRGGWADPGMDRVLHAHAAGMRSQSFRA